jgi:regulator of replication initiation timing
MRSLLSGLGMTAVVGGLIAILWLHVPWEGVVSTGLALLCFAWLVVVLTLPWNLYFQSKAVLFEMQRAREVGIGVRADREKEAQRVERRMLRFSVGMHVGSAALAALATALSHGRWGYVFAGSYLLSGIFRPGIEYYRYLRERLGHLATEVRFPRDDVKALKAEVRELREKAGALEKAEEALRKRLEKEETRAEAKTRDLERRFVSLGRAFEETVDKLTDNQQILSGIKAFLRLVKTAGGDPEPAAPV